MSPPSARAGTTKRWGAPTLRSSSWRVAQWIVGIAIVAFAAREVFRRWADVRDQPLEWHARPVLIIGSAVLVWVMYALLIGAWRMMLAAWGQHLALVPAARIWTVSSLGKYIPGKVWAIAGMAMMARRAGVEAWAATASAIILQALAVGSGAAVVGVTGVALLETEYPWIRPALFGLAAASAAGMALLLSPRFVRWLLRLARIDAPVAASPGAAPVVLGAAANVVAWTGYGVALWLLARGLLVVPELTVSRAVAAFTASYIAGLLFLPAPGGLGVREGVFVLMLDGVVGTRHALALAAASRLLLTVTELGAAAPFLASYSRERNVAES